MKVTKYPLVSAIVTTKNEEDNIGRLLASLKAQSYKKIEVIVIDHPKTSDKTAKIAKKYTKKVFVKGPERSFQRNFGVGKAGGEYVLILDADMVLGKKVVEECINEVKSSPYGGLVVPEKSFGKGFWAKTKALEREINKGEFFFEAARFFPKRVFEEFNGYDTTLTGPEDWDLPQRISKKYEIGRIKAEIKHNEGAPTLFGFMRRKYYYGLSAHKYLKKQKISVISPTTVYFLRPAIYKNWRRVLDTPLIGLGMIVMLLLETLGGGLGYLVGRMRG